MAVCPYCGVNIDGDVKQFIRHLSTAHNRSQKSPANSSLQTTHNRLQKSPANSSLQTNNVTSKQNVCPFCQNTFSTVFNKKRHIKTCKKNPPVETHKTKSKKKSTSEKLCRCCYKPCTRNFQI